MKNLPWLVLVLLLTVSCSGSKSSENVAEDAPQIELSDADEFIGDPNEEIIIDDEFSPAPEDGVAEEVVIADEMVEPMPVEEPLENTVIPEEMPSVAEVAPVENMNSVPNDMSMGGEEKTYTVSNNETLMIIAFKIYGDYTRWREIANYNQGVLGGSTSISAGMQLKYLAPATEFVWNPEGLPYLIKTGDTLGRISNNVYGTMARWRLIWNNNRPLIKDPNKIYAGFTIYYIENPRDVASEI